jgi:hypothetical protein
MAICAIAFALLLSPAALSIGGVQVAGPEQAQAATLKRLAGANRYATMQAIV